MLDRVKERIESDLTTDELQRLVDEALVAIEDRYGPPADPAEPITAPLSGFRRTLDLIRPLDEAETVTIEERSHTAATPLLLAADDFRVLNGGRTLERLPGGTNSRRSWNALVDVTYVPVNDGNQRQEVAIKLVQLAVEYQGVDRRRIGDTETYTAGYHAERERLLGSLAPRQLLVR